MPNSFQTGSGKGHLLTPPHIGNDLPKQQAWRPLLDKWVCVLNRYLHYEDNVDMPHWQNDERSHTGFLAAAVWLLGGYAVEQFSTSRGGDNSNDTGAGFVDLYFALPEFDLRCVVEAKIEWPSIVENSQRKIEDQLKKAERQLLSMAPADREDVNVCLAVCWVVPEQTPNGSETSQLSQLTAPFLEDEDTIVATYHIPHKYRAACEEQLHENKTYPGIIFIGKLWKSPEN